MRTNSAIGQPCCPLCHLAILVSTVAVGVSRLLLPWIPAKQVRGLWDNSTERSERNDHAHQHSELDRRHGFCDRSLCGHALRRYILARPKTGCGKTDEAPSRLTKTLPIRMIDQTIWLDGTVPSVSALNRLPPKRNVRDHPVPFEERC